MATEQRGASGRDRTNGKTIVSQNSKQPTKTNKPKTSNMMRISFTTVSILLLAALYLLTGAEANGLRTTSSGNNERRLGGLPSTCPSDAIPGTCHNCNHGGCGLFTCSAFTQWECPSGYEVCGYESCLGGACPIKKWCSKST